MKKLFFFIILLSASLTISAQTSRNHTIQRGETLESIAQAYGVTVTDIRNANPNANNYFYVGMILVIPERTASPKVEQQEETVYIIAPEPKKKPKKAAEAVGYVKQKVQGVSLHSDLQSEDFTSIGATIGWDGSDLVGWTYGIQGQYFLDNGWGASLGLEANWVLSKTPDKIVKMGASYVYPLTNRFYVMGTGYYTLTFAEDRYSGTVSGIAIVPTFGVALKNWRIGLNGNLQWRHGGKLHLGAYFNFSYCF